MINKELPPRFVFNNEVINKKEVTTINVVNIS